MPDPPALPDSGDHKDPYIFHHHGRDLLLVPGLPIYAYALRKDPAPQFPPREEPGADKSYGGWGKPLFVTPDDDPEDEEGYGGWGEPIARYGGDVFVEEEEKEIDPGPLETFRDGYIDEHGNTVGSVDLVWAFEGVPVWDGVKYNGLSDESKRLFQAVGAVNEGVPPDGWANFDPNRSRWSAEIWGVTGSNGPGHYDRESDDRFNCRVHGEACPNFGGICGLKPDSHDLKVSYEGIELAYLLRGRLLNQILTVTVQSIRNETDKIHLTY
ncbi:hypothetical protein NMY22_g5031 [Coprinellus aureogranulatus]|nr:hypothetical protein NMY22_g5031 [Coprinellus aureogranulatus]